MRKSLIIMTGLALGACLALSLLMQQAADLGRELSPKPYQSRLDEVLGERLAAASKVRVVADAGQRRLRATLQAAAGERPSAVAARAGELLWRKADELRAVIVAVEVHVGTPDGKTLVCEVPRGAAAPTAQAAPRPRQAAPR
ncbi:MAG: hypothetical protein RL398_3167 [Planctomycetota bacterium]